MDSIYRTGSGQSVTVDSFHAHIYFNADQLDAARLLGEAVRDGFAAPMGRLHSQPVGPHPRGSCQMTVDNEKIGAVLTWLAINRAGLTIFVHPNTGDDLMDHTDHVIWLGESETLSLAMLS